MAGFSPDLTPKVFKLIISHLPVTELLAGTICEAKGLRWGNRLTEDWGWGGSGSERGVSLVDWLWSL